MFKSSNKRSIYLIDKSFQLNFIARFVILVVCCALISGALLAVFYYVKYDMVISNGKEILLRYTQKDVQPVKKIQLPANSEVVQAGNNQYTVLNGELYLVSNKIAYKTYERTKYRIKDKKLEAYSLARNKYRPAGSLTYVVQKGQLGQMLLSGGKKTFIAVKPPAGRHIDVNNLRTTDRFEIVIFALIVSTLIFIIILIIFGVFFSHRLAGPIYRLGLSIDRIASGDLDFQVKLRRNDAFQHIADKLNTLIGQLKKK